MKLALFGVGIGLFTLASERAVAYFWPTSGAIGAWGIPLAAAGLAGVIVHHI